MTDDGLIDGATVDAFVATDWDADKDDVAKKRARESVARNSNAVTSGTPDTGCGAPRHRFEPLRAIQADEEGTR